VSLNVLSVASRSYRLVRALHEVVDRPDLRLPLLTGEDCMHLLTVSHENYALMQQIVDVVENHAARSVPGEVAALRAEVAELKAHLAEEEAANVALAKELVEARRAR